MSEWAEFKVKLPSGDTLPDGCRSLETIHHVVHVPSTRRILEDGKLRAGLVFDESRLNKSRISVNWLSANTWGPGSIYGNVQFSFKWADLVKECRFYWVEAMKDYSPEAYRILISEKDLSKNPHLILYDPLVDKGPLRKKGDNWYWNCKYTSEFMFDRDISLSECINFEFIEHHPNICRTYKGCCKYKAARTYEIGGVVLSFIIGSNIDSVDHILGQKSVYRASGQLSDVVDTAINGLVFKLTAGKNRFGGVIKSKSSRIAVVRGALALYGTDQLDAARDLLVMLNSEDVFFQALEELINEHFNITGWTLDR